jgi:hypothetical protein
MGGFTENPPPPAAPDYPPENAFDVESFTTDLHNALEKLNVITKEGALKWKHEPGWFEKELLAILSDIALLVATGLAAVLEAARPTLETLTVGVSEVMQPMMGLLSDLTSVYVHGVGGIPPEETGGKLPVGPGPSGEAAGVVFDKIMAPMLHILTPSNPEKSGAGEANSQAILGTIINLHLSTWAVNIISNLTGLGALKFINSFDDAIMSGINARGFSRLACKPYLDKYVVTPLTKDLNRQWPLEIGSPSQLVKRFIRGNMTGEELKAALRERGFDDEVVTDMVLDAAKLLTTDGAAWAVKNGFWTEEQAIRELQYLGYTAEMARVVLQMQLTSQIDAEGLSLAHSLIDAMVDRRIDQATVRHLLASTALTEDEINAMVTRGAILQELSRRLTLSQVKSLYAESLVDLDYVLNFLRDEGYSDQDADLLALLEFTKAADRAQRKKDLLERRRVDLEAQLGYEKEADAARAAELAALGGPTS